MSNDEMTVPETIDEEIHYCEVHTDRETELRCNKCGRYMCAQCAVQTPIGYRCRECVRNVENTFFKGTTLDYVIAAVVCAAVSGGGFFALLVIGVVGIWLVSLFAALLLGGFAAQIALSLTGKRRGRYSAQVAAGASALGALVPILVLGLPLVSLPIIVYVGVFAFTVYGRFQVKI